MAEPEALPDVPEGNNPGLQIPQDHKVTDESPPGWINIKPDSLSSAPADGNAYFFTDVKMLARYPREKKLTYLVGFQQPPNNSSFFNIAGKVFMHEQSEKGLWITSYMWRPYLDLGVLEYFGDPLLLSLMTTPIPLVMGIQDQWGENVDLTSTSMAIKCVPFKKYRRHADISANVEKVLSFEQEKEQSNHTLKCTLLGTGFSNFREEEKLLGNTVKIKLISPFAHPVPNFIHDHVVPLQEPKTDYYWCDAHYITEVKKGFDIYAQLIDWSTERSHAMMDKMGLSELNYSLNPRRILGIFHGEEKYALPFLLPRPYAHELKFISESTNLRMVYQSAGSGKFSASSVARFEYTSARAIELNSLLAAFSESPSTTPTFMSLLFRWMLEGYMVKPLFQRPFKDSRLVMEAALYMMLIPPFGTGLEFHREVCKIIASDLSISDENAYSNILSGVVPRSWATKKNTAFFKLLSLCANFKWKRLRVRASVVDRVTYLYVPAVYYDSFTAQRPNEPFGPTYQERTSPIARILSSMSDYYSQFAAGFMQFFSFFTRKASSDSPFMGSLFGPHFLRSQIDFFNQLLATAETKWATRVPFMTTSYNQQLIFNINPFCVLTYPHAEGEEMNKSIDIISAAENPAPMDPPTLVSVLEYEHEVNMVELVTLIGMWSFHRGHTGSAYSHAYIATYLFTIVLAEQTCQHIFTPEKPFFQPGDCKPFPQPEFGKIQPILKDFYLYFLFLAEWQLSHDGKNAHLPFVANMAVFDSRVAGASVPSTCYTHLLCANNVLDWGVPLTNDFPFYKLEKPPGDCYRQTADEAVNLVPTLMDDFDVQTLVSRCAGKSLGRRVKSTTNHVILSVPAYSGSLDLYQNLSSELKHLVVGKLPKIIRPPLGGYKFSACEIMYPLVPTISSLGLDPPYIVKMAQCDADGKIVRPFIRVKLGPRHRLLLDDDPTETTMSRVFEGKAVGATLMRFYAVKHYTVIPLIPPTVATVLRSALSVMYQAGK